MESAQKLLLIYGVVVFVYGCVLGVAMSQARMKAASAPRALVTTHLSALMQAPLFFGLGWAINAAGFTGGLATTAAVLLVVGGTAEQIGGTLNWLQKTGDQFAERSLGFRFNALSGPLVLIGAVIVAIGVIKGVV